MKRAQRALFYLITFMSCLFIGKPNSAQPAVTQSAPTVPSAQAPMQLSLPTGISAGTNTDINTQEFVRRQPSLLPTTPQSISPDTPTIQQPIRQAITGLEPQIPNIKRSRSQLRARSAKNKRSMAELTQDQKAKIKKREPRRNTTRATRTVLNTVYLEQFLDPWRGLDETEAFQLNFENRQLRDFLKFVENTLRITFILPDDLQPEPAGYDPIGNTKITFESQFPMNRKQIWDLTLTFLDMLNFAPVPTSEARTYQVLQSGTSAPGKPSANREPLPTFIGTDPEFLPDNNAKIRYVYFVENADLQTIHSVIETMKSSFAGPIIDFPALRAIIMTDRAANIKALTKILRELDQVAMPETLAIIKLTRADAQRVAILYNELIGKAGPGAQQPPFNPFLGGGPRRPTSTQYFTPATRVFAEPRSNSLIILGTRENVQRVEDFIVKEIDREIALPFSPLHIIQLRYIQAEPIAGTLNEIIQGFNKATPDQNAAIFGGIRDGNQFFRPTVRIIAEPSGNRLIINADYEEYLKLLEVIQRLDVEQPQVAIKVLILNVDLIDQTQLGTQLRNTVDCCDGTGGASSVLGTNINFQTSGPATGSIVQRVFEPGTTTTVNGAQRLLGNLIALASDQPIGTTLVTLGQDMFGVWGIVKALESYTKTSIIANPYLITTHKYKAEVSVGETRRVAGAQVISGAANATGTVDIEANLTVSITPQISYDDTITLGIYVSLEQFTSPDPTNGDRLIKRLSTEALLVNKEVLALGGLIRDNVNELETKVPILGDIPLIGWLFKSKIKTVQRSSLLILLSPEIIRPLEPEAAKAFTQLKINDAKYTMFSAESRAERHDPIHRFIFKDNRSRESSQIDRFVSTQERYIDESQKKIAVPLALNTTPRKSLVDLVKPEKSHNKPHNKPQMPKNTQKASGVAA